MTLPGTPDDWLPRWLPLLRQSVDSAGGAPVLELGCGTGRDTEVLVANGLGVVALELLPAQLELAHQRVPAGADFHQQDIRAPFPIGEQGPGEVGAVLASLSLHYFDWAQTLEMAARIRRTLQPGGLLLCRLNSVRDVHHGAQGDYPRIDPDDPDFLHVDGWDKRFFDRPQVDRMFADGWNWVGLEERTVMRYAEPKVLWEAALRRA
ncbi:class I SAM-dependent methyltransferase [Variovorax sp. OV329]|uniref:class I SAM-dependent methyltransferase n=1 Tax=Variovorax sp. OV329 TaxID=1882825 RepID=UPI0008EC93CE|nr:class I SAM-dependent methyltransferase [Variovorax sp. OV329]SFM72832.1 SAM-dependent methyltransferase [Variovorax sp. OV329]